MSDQEPSTSIQHALRSALRSALCSKRWLWAWRAPEPRACLAGAAMVLAAPPFDVLPMVFVALALLAAALEGLRAARAAGAASLFAVVACAGGMRFVPAALALGSGLGPMTAVSLFAVLVVVQALGWALAGCVTGWLRGRLPFELAFGAAIYVALLVPTPLPWSPAMLLAPWPAWLQLSDVLGERGVAALLAALAALLAGAISRAVSAAHGPASVGARARWRAAARAGGPRVVAAVALSMLLVGHGAVAMAVLEPGAGPVLRVAAVQAATPAETSGADARMRLAALKRQTRAVESEGVDLVVWPQSAFPYDQPIETRHLGRGPRSPVGDGVRGPVLVGLRMNEHAIRATRLERLDYDAAIIASPEGKLTSPYLRVEPLPWVEQGPFGGPASSLARLVRGTVAAAGTTVARLSLGESPQAVVLARPAGDSSVAFGLMLGTEALSSTHAIRLATSVAPAILVALSDEAAFAESAAGSLHLRAATLRAIELRRDLLRVANRGPCAWIDARGHVRATSLPTASTFVASPAIVRAAPTVFARFGHLPFLAAWAAALLGGAVVRRLRRRSLAAD